MHAIILGSGSDIGCELGGRLSADGWRVTKYRHNDNYIMHALWDLVVCCYGVLEPIGSFWEADPAQWERAFEANLFLPLRKVRALYPHRRPGASVCFFSGAGTGGPAPTYSAYAASKIALVKATELLDDESPDCKFFVLGPGIVRTKIHEQTLRAGERAANYQRVAEFVGSTDPNDPDDFYVHLDIYACLMACVAAPKAVVGGRNICVHLDDWSRLGELAADPDMFKLRRAGDGVLRRNHESI